MTQRSLFAAPPEPSHNTVSTECEAPGREECPECGYPVPPQSLRRGEPKSYCSDRCRARAYDRTHPRIAVQNRDKTPQWRRIVERLRQGPATHLELLQASGSMNVTGRISEARQKGYRIVCDKSGEHPVYKLCEEP